MTRNHSAPGSFAPCRSAFACLPPALLLSPATAASAPLLPVIDTSSPSPPTIADPLLLRGDQPDEERVRKLRIEQAAY